MNQNFTILFGRQISYFEGIWNDFLQTKMPIENLESFEMQVLNDFMELIFEAKVEDAFQLISGFLADRFGFDSPQFSAFSEFVAALPGIVHEGIQIQNDRHAALSDFEIEILEDLRFLLAEYESIDSFIFQISELADRVGSDLNNGLDICFSLLVIIVLTRFLVFSADSFQLLNVPENQAEMQN